MSFVPVVSDVAEFARRHLVAHRCVVHEYRLDRRGFRQIFCLETLVGLHVRVVRSRLVIRWILNELESRIPTASKTEVIGSTGVPHAGRQECDNRACSHDRKDERSSCWAHQRLIWSELLEKDKGNHKLVGKAQPRDHFGVKESCPPTVSPSNYFLSNLSEAELMQ